MQMSDRIGRRIKLHDLHVLMAVMQAGSMRKAAALLNTTQSAISRSIADLEQTIGARLLDRSSGHRPDTLRARTPQARCRRFRRVEAGRAGNRISFQSRGRRTADWRRQRFHGRFCAGDHRTAIATISTRRVSLMPSALPALYDQLRERRIELAISGDSALDRPEDIDAEVLFEEPLAVAASAENPWVRRRRVQLADLVNESWTWPSPGSAVGRSIVEAFRASRLEPPRVTVYTDAMNVRIRLAVTRGFLTVVPASMLSFPGKHESLRRLPVELTRRQVGILTLKNRTLSPLARLFIEYAREIAEPLANAKRASCQLNKSQ